MASPGCSPNAPSQGYRTTVTEMIAEWIRQGTEGFIATQKILLDLAAQQNALALTIVRERLGMIPTVSFKAVIDLTGACLQNFIEAQQIILDVAARQNSILADGLKPAYADTTVDRLATIVHEGVDTCITGQKEFLTFFEIQAETAIDEFGKTKTFDSKRLSKLARDGVHTFVKNQKQFLDVVEEELTATEPAGAPETEGKSVDLFDMAKQSIDAFVEAERRLLDLTSDQINVNVRFVKDVFQKPDRDKVTALPDIVKKSVDSFVAAQKALVDLASKPRTAAENSHPEILVGRA
jgi:hypothetical protein